MKIRHGFVSNSSSTSFCLYGIRIECYDGEKFVNRLKERKPELLKKIIEESSVENTEDLIKMSEKYPEEFWEIILYGCKNEIKDLEIESMPEDEDFCIGRGLVQLKDGETGGEFKERTKTDIIESYSIFLDEGKDFKFKIYAESWYDG